MYICKLSGFNNSIGDLILIILYHVVSFCTEVEVATTYYVHHKGRCFPISGGGHEPTAQKFNGLSTETR